MTGFIKDISLLEEKVSDNDFLNISSSVETLSEKLTSVSTNLMLGIVGAFGVGKSTLISKTKNSKGGEEEWIHFDAWQFPDRKELWDGLVLETARHLGKLEIAKRELSGTSKKDVGLAIETVGSVVKVVAGIATGGFSSILEPLYETIKPLKYFTEQSPATRVFEIQEVFISLINSIDKEKIIFVLEDVDRSGEDGLFFLETFRQFLSNNKLNKKVIVITPISNDSYYTHLETYLKCLDYVEFFNKKDKRSLRTFVNNFYKSEDNTEKEKLTAFLEYLYNKYPDMTLRKIKLILRQANLNFIELKRKGFNPSDLVCIGVSASRYVKNGSMTFFEQFSQERVIRNGNEIARFLLITNSQYLVYTNRLMLNDDNTLVDSVDIYLTSRPTPEDMRYPSLPYSYTDLHSDAKQKVGLPDFYFNEL